MRHRGAVSLAPALRRDRDADGRGGDRIILGGVPAVAVTRGERVESVHAVAACACEADGTVRLALGAVDEPVFLRSTAKPFIAAAVVRAGTAAAFGFTGEEIALAAASHAGEPAHAATAAAMLAKIGASPDDLAIPLAHNCSGKHAGLLALARLRGAPLAGYRERDHPVQQEVLAFCARVFGEPLGADRLAIDGCGIPVFAIGLRAAARTYARLASPDAWEPSDGEALAVVRDAMLAHPWFVGGSARLDTALMQAMRGRLVAKSGAEAVHGSVALDAGLGLVMKVVDGAPRAVGPAVIALLERLGVLAGDARLALEAQASLPVRNASDRIVGRICALEATSACPERSERP